ncbi:MAG TPA: hypothetical protein VMG10_26880 [Gemmataceae bacterium]|nr:hypothetical protein [Gemmataceae bacterium]
MGHALIWIEGLAAMLFLIALAAACSSRWSRRFRQLAPPLLTALAVLLLAAPLTYGAALLKFRFHGLVPHDWFFYSLSWTIIFLVGVRMIFSRGLKRSGEERIPPARSWPRGRLALALAGAVVLFAITLSNMDLAMKVQLAEARAEASTVLLAMTPPPIDEKDNAAPLYQEAFAALPPMDNWLLSWNEKRPLPPWKQQVRTWTGKVRWRALWSFPDAFDSSFDWRDKELKNFLHSQGQTLTLLRKAGPKPACRFPQRDPLSFFDGAGARYSLESQFSQASLLLALDARVQAAAGDNPTAVDDIAAILGIARHTSDLGVEKEAWETLAALLHLSSPKPDELARLPRSEGLPYLRMFPKTQASYALRGLSMMSAEWPSYRFWDLTRELPFLHRRGQPMPAGYEAPFWFEAVVSVWRIFLASDELLWFQRSLKECRDFLASPEQQSFTDWQELLQSLREQKGGWFYVNYMKIRLESTARYACDVTTLRRYSRLAIALIAYRAKHGEYPKTLEELTPGFLDRLPRDPWDGGPLHMKATEKGVELFTLRNGGDKPILSPDTAAQRRDIIFRLPRGRGR